jgi:hypothetical protein
MTNDATSQTTSTPADAGANPSPQPGVEQASAAASPNPSASPPASAPDGSAPAPQAPAGLESFWDAATGALKTDEVAAQFKQLSEFKAQQDARLAGLPAKPDDYQLALPDDVKFPEGVTFQLDDKNPMVPALKTWAHGHKVDPAAVNQLAGIYAQAEAAKFKAVEQAHQMEMQTLGANAQARLDNLKTFLTASVGETGWKALAPGIYSAEAVKALEALQSQLKNGGMPAASGAGRVPGVDPASVSLADRLYPTMTRKN